MCLMLLGEPDFVLGDYDSNIIITAMIFLSNDDW